MAEICKASLCTGCWACFNVCSKNAISMNEGKLGHLYPSIDEEKCINCGLCVKVCPSIQLQKKNTPIKAYAGWAKDWKEYTSSTSGGIASILSRYIIRNGGVVYGCACLENLDIRHIRIVNEKDLDKLKGSKYVQSCIYDSYQLVKKDLIDGFKVLFIGTPCQVSGLKSFLRKEYNNLYLLDLICHGVPSSYLLKKYIHDVAPFHHYDKVVFRDFQGKYVLNVYADSKTIYHEKLNRKKFEGWYVSTFFEGFTYRDSCYQCQYARPERCSDITIGDFWGLGKKYIANDIPEHTHGISVLLPITEKGEKIIEEVKTAFNIFERPLDEAIEGNSQLNAPVKYTRRKSLFRMLFNVIGYKAYKLCWIDIILKLKVKSLLKI